MSDKAKVKVEERPDIREFLYNASALALGGQITRPCCEIIEPQAPVVLPIVGGHAHARVENFRFGNLFSFRSATTTVIGNNSGGAGDAAIFNTLATVEIEGLDIGGGVLTADRVVARLVSEHSFDKPELAIHPVGSSFDNLRLVGEELKPRACDVLFCGRTRDEMEIEEKKEGGQRREAPRPVDLYERPLAFSRLWAEKSHVLTSLYERPKDLPRGCRPEGAWGIHVEGFGSVYLGEIVLSHGERRLTMIRVKMGSPVRGVGSLAAVGGNGTTHP